MKSVLNLLAKLFLLMIIISAVTGCATKFPASVNGECRVFHDPGFAVQGKRLRDKQWIGATQETGIEICGWKRPTQ